MVERREGWRARAHKHTHTHRLHGDGRHGEVDGGHVDRLAAELGHADRGLADGGDLERALAVGEVDLLGAEGGEGHVGHADGGDVHLLGAELDGAQELALEALRVCSSSIGCVYM